MADTKIQFHDSDACFRPAQSSQDDNWIDTSFSQSPRALGDLRMPSVNNGRYESKHPVVSASGDTIGFLAGGQSSLGYTFACVHTGGCFWIAHQGFHATMNGGGSAVSLVDQTGSFFFSKGLKYGVVKSFGFGDSWVNAIDTFKLLNDGEHLVYLTKYGVCLFDTRRRDIVSKVEFSNLAYQWSGFSLSPKVLLLAIAFSERGDKDPLDGEHRYRNFVRLYNLESGNVVGEQGLPASQHTNWTIDFSEDGRQLQVESKSSKHVFSLNASS